MLNLLEKIEAMINLVLTKIGEIFMMVISKIVPPVIKENIAGLTRVVPNLKAKIKKKLQELVKIKFKEIDYKALLRKVIAFGGKYGKKIFAYLSTLKPDKDHLQEILYTVLRPFVLLYSKIVKWLSSLSPLSRIFVILGFLILIIGTYNISHTIQKLIALHTPALHKEIVKRAERPAYHNAEPKLFPLRELNIPVFIEGRDVIRELTIDVTLEASNRYIPAYFEKKGYLIRDKLSIGFQPIIPRFPLEEEGKQIIKEKIISEVNELIKEHHIEGEIVKVHLDAIITE